MSVKKNILKNGIASFLQKGIRILDQLLLVPFFITSWGVAYYGEWLTLTIIPTLLGLSDFGFGTAAANTFVLRYASGDKKGAADIAKSGYLIAWIMIFFGLFISVLALYILDYFKIFDKSLINKQDAIISISILMLARLLSFLQQIFEAYYRSVRKANISINILSFNTGFCLLLSVIVLYFGGGVIYFALANLISTTIFLIVYITVAKRLLPISKQFKGDIVKTDIKYVINKGLAYLFTPIWQAIYFQGSTFVVRIVLGAEAVAIFNTVRTVARSVNQVFNLVSSSIISELQFEYGNGNLEKVRKIFRMALSFVIVVAFCGIIFLYVGGPWLYEMWTQKALKPPTAMWNIFLIGIGFNAVWWISSVIFQATNRPFDFAVAGTIAAIISVIGSYFLTEYYGLTGAAIGNLILDLILFLYVLPRSCKLIGQPLYSLIKDSLSDSKQIIKEYL